MLNYYSVAKLAERTRRPQSFSCAHFRRLFEEYGLPKRIRSDNGVPFASNALARL